MMSEERLAEIEAEHARPTRSAYDNHDQLLTLADAIPELIAEVRRLRDSIVSLNQDLDSMRDERDEALARAEKADAEVERLREEDKQ